jgi:hypothetical protein
MRYFLPQPQLTSRPRIVSSNVNSLPQAQYPREKSGAALIGDRYCGVTFKLSKCSSASQSLKPR